jgi:hypothetical protein
MIFFFIFVEATDCRLIETLALTSRTVLYYDRLGAVAKGTEQVKFNITLLLLLQ